MDAFCRNRVWYRQIDRSSEESRNLGIWNALDQSARHIRELTTVTGDPWVRPALPFRNVSRLRACSWARNTISYYHSRRTISVLVWHVRIVVRRRRSGRVHDYCTTVRYQVHTSAAWRHCSCSPTSYRILRPGPASLQYCINCGRDARGTVPHVVYIICQDSAQYEHSRCVFWWPARSEATFRIRFLVTCKTPEEFLGSFWLKVDY